MKIKTYDPGCSVKLYKTVLRDKVHDKASASGRYRIPVYDLTPYLGETGGIRVSKGVGSPAGSFTLTFPDSMVKESGGRSVLESIYGLVEPMDLVEIRFARAPHSYANGLPIVMRGWVTTINRAESIGPDGRPVRSVVVSGQDFGKIWQILRLYYVANAATGDNVIHGFKLMQKYGIDFDKNLPIADFISQLGERIVSPWLENLLACSSSLAEEWLRVKMDVSAIGMVNYQYVNNFQGSLYDLLADVCDVRAGFKELFSEDREDGVYLVCRQTPWYEPDGSPVNINTPAEMDKVIVRDSSIVSISASRSDANVANAFWVSCPVWNLISDLSMRLNNNYYVENGLNNSPAHYGYRLLEAEVRSGPPSGFVSDRLTAEQQEAAGDAAAKWQLSHMQLMRTLHKDDVVLERGSIRMKGNEKVRPGKFLDVRRGTNGQRTWVAYASHVDHDYVPFQGFFTTVQFERGTGFVERAKLEESPYLSEISPIGFV